ncbi:hypothetical protein HL658_19115 [Azospirillum sp. RWY-5-1]|nr:hypothetical protein [Azospirillum oleiclasticum]
MPQVALAGRSLAHLRTHRFSRADVAAGADQIVPQSGVVIEYLRDAPPTGEPEPVGPLTIDDASWEVEGTLTFHAMHYDGLLTTDKVLGARPHLRFRPTEPHRGARRARSCGRFERPGARFRLRFGRAGGRPARARARARGRGVRSASNWTAAPSARR